MYVDIKFDSVRSSALAGAKELFYHARALQLYPWGLMENSKKLETHPNCAPNQRPVLFVHGVIHNRSAFFPMKRVLREMGFTNLFGMNYSTRHGSLTGMIEDIANRVESILEKTHSKQIDIVAHSLGGLIARHYMSVGAGRGQVKQLITLGSAHKGTSASPLLKLFLGGSLSKDLRRKSYFIKTINDTAIPKSSRLVSVYSKNDWTVWPQHSCHLYPEPGQNFYNYSIDSTGHVGLLYNPLVFELVRQRLSEDDF